MTEPVSLHSFCKENGNLPKTSVRRWLNDHGYSTSNGLSPAAVEAAIEQFCPTAVEAAPATGGLSIHTGNHCTAIEVPGFEGLTIDLGQFRDSEALIIDDPLAVAEQFLQTADLIQGALASDIADREQRLYRLQATQLDTATTEKTTALADALAQLQSLGKPAAAADTTT